MGLERTWPGPAVGTIAANVGGMQVLLCIISIMHASIISNIHLCDKPISVPVSICFASLLHYNPDLNVGSLSK